MSCKESAAVVASLLDDSLSLLERRQGEAHVDSCAHCRDALADARETTAQLRQWQDTPVPQWQRIPQVLRESGRSARPGFSFWGQWAPLAAAFMLVLAVLFQVRLEVTDGGFSVAFGGQAERATDGMEQRLARFEQEQRAAQQQALHNFAGQLEQQQAATNARLLDAMLQQFGESSTRNMEQVLAYFQAQRRQDLQLLEASYQRLVDSDFQTIRSVQQLANYVQYQGGQ